MKTIEDSLNIPTENENSEMQLGMIAHTYNPSAWEFETIISSYTQGISKEKKKKEGGVQCYKTILLLSDYVYSVQKTSMNYTLKIPCYTFINAENSKEKQNNHYFTLVRGMSP